MEGILNSISDYTFPIVACVGMGYVIVKMIQTNRDDTIKRENNFFEQLNKYAESLDKFNSTLIGVDTRLKSIEDDVKKINVSRETI